MSIQVACSCGQHFLAPPHLFGKQVNCPKCGCKLQIGGQNSPPQKPILVNCSCGRKFAAKPHLLGKTVLCPGCQQPLVVEEQSSELVSLDDWSTSNALSGYGAPTNYTSPTNLGLPTNYEPAPYSFTRPVLPPSRSSSDFSSLGKWLLLGGGVFALLCVLVLCGAVLIAVLQNAPSLEIASQPSIPPASPAPQPTPAANQNPFAIPSASSGMPNGSTASPSPSVNPVDTANSQPSSRSRSSSSRYSSSRFGSSSDVEPASSSPNNSSSYNRAASGSSPSSSRTSRTENGFGSSSESLPAGLTQWHQSSNSLRGMRRIENSESPLSHHSFFCDLLPFLGHQKLYEKLDFSRTAITETNLNCGANVVPQFLIPGDSRASWEGYPFDGLALTHFVGMSGVEDRRDVVAATLPRSDPRAGIFGYDEVASPDRIKDGTSQTLMMISNGELASPWLLGGGATIRGAREPYFGNISGFGSRSRGGQTSAIAVFADGSVRTISGTIDPRVFRAACTIAGSESVDLDGASTRTDLNNSSR